MNLKESFRYQNYLDRIMREAEYSITYPAHCILTRKKHCKSVANPDDIDFEEVVEVDEFIPNDVVISFMEYLIDQKKELGVAISNAKKELPIDIDAEIEANKFRQRAHEAIKAMLVHKPKKKKEYGTGYRFNVEGNQSSYTYDIEVTQEELFNRQAGKRIMKQLALDSDSASEEIDKLTVNTEVLYTPEFDVNSTFEDVIAEYAERFAK